jgi:stalled ribosome rescue protein Dom34
MDHQNAHVLMFDREHVQAERIKSRNTHSHQGKHADSKSYFAAISHELEGVHEVLLTGPGNARTEFRSWCEEHAKGCAHAIVDSLASDHPTDPQLVAMGRKYFTQFDKMAADPSQL